ncbi:large ribosomal RNA subunit accumulation protein YCED homolog 1, chloroplastic-like [Selaginella moellendorffii]|uniref:large ribosomal RNA subunit accumulation protein YCED homolog 1, chloroplastic-like n=1 Tax=Selaginella moellendorffii TaxID=88036 RepID=UPI000D1C46E0|nr:large ribosomal RNA subunit accumulation protein YCED homolog 1, chloroplastic-like [Selaginella moellendorffii]|eukprot:XP_024519064.1 large ribosomal RNA subunit accumulation protein YCED homolog 1, chloroplastic-like [Selaginella moellendorffii]
MLRFLLNPSLLVLVLSSQMSALGAYPLSSSFSSNLEVAWRRKTPPRSLKLSQRRMHVVSVFPSQTSDPPVPSSVTYKRSAVQSHFECQTTLENLGLKQFSSKVSRTLATSMGVLPGGADPATATPVGVSYDVTKDKSGDLKLNGIVKTAVCVLCDSVLLSRTPVEEPTEPSIGVVLGEEPEPGEPVLDIDLDDKFHFPDEVKVMDLSSYIRDTVHLDVPYFSICSSICKGLCTRCGLNLNTSECTCRDDSTDDDEVLETK